MPDHQLSTEAMTLAIAASEAALRAGNMPFGATLLSPTGKILHTSQNNQVTTGDCTGHAEVVLVREATHKLGSDCLRGATVYASGEPCAMCSGAMFWAGIKTIVFAASTVDIAKALGGPDLPISSREVLAKAHPPVEVYGPFMDDEAITVLRQFA